MNGAVPGKSNKIDSLTVRDDKAAPIPVKTDKTIRKRAVDLGFAATRSGAGFSTGTKCNSLLICAPKRSASRRGETM